MCQSSISKDVAAGVYSRLVDPHRFARVIETLPIEADRDAVRLAILTKESDLPLHVESEHAPRKKKTRKGVHAAKARRSELNAIRKRK